MPTITLNPKEYEVARIMIAANDADRISYGKNSIPKEIANSFAFADVVDNDLRSAVETYKFLNERPDKYVLYISDKEGAFATATTWTGQKLGNVIKGREFRDNFGSKRVPITVMALNGIRYYGTYFKSAGDYARITKYTHQ